MIRNSNYKSLLAGIFLVLLMQAGTVHAEIKSKVDQLISIHGEVLGAIADNVPSNRVKIGRATTVQNNMGLLHAREVARIINDPQEGAKLMRECCWRPQPAITPTYVISTPQDFLSAATPTPPPAPEALYNPSDAPNSAAMPPDAGRAEFPIPTNYGNHYASVFDQMVRIRAGYSLPLPGGDSMDAFTYSWMKALTEDIPFGFNFTNGTLLPPDSLVARLVWNWSYQLKKYRQFREGLGSYTAHPAAFKDVFRDYYNWGCIVCLGSGFYDTRGMYTQDSNGVWRANEYYKAIVDLLSPAQQAWLSEQYDEGFKTTEGASAPPLQVSFGLTMQSQQTNNPMPVDADSGTYGTHCHTSREIYIPIDPMSLDKKLGDMVLAGQEGSTYDTDSYMAGLPNTSSSTPMFGRFADMQNQVSTNLAGTYTKLANGDVVFWDRRTNHSMFTGQRFQFAAWARTTRPNEGTFFPKDIDNTQAMGGDGTVDPQDNTEYANTCMNIAPTVYDDLCGQPVTFWDNIEIVGPQTAGVTLTGTSGRDLLVAETTGASTLMGLGGDDCLVGGSAVDSLNGGAGDDKVFGREGDDQLIGAGGTDTLDGGDGTDTCLSGEVLINCP